MNTGKGYIAGIVLYNSEIYRLKEVIFSIINQVKEVCLYDNGSDNISEVQTLLCHIENNEKITLLRSHENRGIAYALNQIFIYSKKMGYEWVITLDHDTVCPANMISEYNKAVLLNKAAVICPNVIDYNIARNKWYHECSVPIQEIERCIQTGNLIRIASWEKAGRFDELFFIDYVDFDFCKRIEIVGDKIYRCNSVIVDHELGYRETTPYAHIAELIYQKTNILAFKYLMYNNVFSQNRIYCTFRNNIIYIKKYKKYINVPQEIWSVLKIAVKRLMRSKNKKMVFVYICKGIKCGIDTKVAEFEMNKRMKSEPDR